MMLRDKVLLVDRQDTVLGEMDKLQAHQEGRLHRAFSIFIFNSFGQMLIHQRAETKYHGAGLWTNACCSHPQAGETLAASASERLDYEMGIQCKLQRTFSFVYHGRVENGLVEHELDHVFVGTFDGDPKINREEVADFQWIDLDTLADWLTRSPQAFTIWFRKALPMVVEEMSKRSNP
ncbi:isopentenyl-diphosphate Delta-isomerase [Sphingobacterium griseoflavum]|uniref:Isopentenyl-diphosphate delta-isomerase n=1 Tax=Sphingobacterium griseoflavum TaxID=1474952 RepID=A0ABQ3HQ02_9SPHI|nr:isopentenyl-diphosphate Delta-isomerase [Sphingobacterium griseoflavum]GHE23351.1 isopentenyl-diphosphate Delta-isomerase [Sphingobacterium griseoflavum]